MRHRDGLDDMTRDLSAGQRIVRAGAIVSLLACSLFMQGCLAVAWVTAVSVDSARSSDVEFRPFEQSWVSPSESVTGDSDALVLTSLALVPVQGDTEMGNRLTEVLRRQTALTLESTNKLGREIVVPDTDKARADLAKDLSRDLAVDAVLFGRVSTEAAHPSDWGWKQEESRRLFLYLVDRGGRLLWKDELPFTVVNGPKPAIENSVQTALSNHFMGHVHDLRLDDLGYLPKRSS